ncbi:MAG: hypothetical protein AVDCRST_MAG43-596 [uncultured Thermomicrobiales bacterium]|uniref:Uncharacterized protein n=1 Tax=uncultured Thermomicrobiales bacterium TaxID=1645740 RepID=A0A6J4UEA5_9BACT|nr:MAG: hypothetical protein AVDCRST_MAG43-596 [uncultured Thermomicrobiales bacterium]
MCALFALDVPASGFGDNKSSQWAPPPAKLRLPAA